MGDSLTGKTAVVTGAGGGIGSGIARFLAAEGASVVINDPGRALDGSGAARAPADDVVAAIEAAGGRAVASYDSVTEFEAGERLVQMAVDSFGGLDIVVTAHGILRDRMVFNMSEQEWDEVIDVHLTGTFNVVRHACTYMRPRRSGRIVTVSSTSGLVGNPGQANYGAAKAGIGGLTKVVARDMGRYGVTCNCIVPVASTRMTQSVSDEAQVAPVRARHHAGGARLAGRDSRPGGHRPVRRLPSRRLCGERQRPVLLRLRELGGADVPAPAGAEHRAR